MRLPLKGIKPGRPAFSRTGDRIAVPDFTDTLPIYETVSGRLATELKQEEARFETASFSPDGRLLVTTSAFANSRHITTLWDVVTAKERQRFKETDGFAVVSTFSPDGKLLAGSTTPWPGAVVLWDVATGAEVRRFQTWNFAVHLQFSANTKTLAAGTSYGEVAQWDVGTGKPLAASASPPVNTTGLRFSADSKQLTTSSEAVRCWDVTSCSELWQSPPSMGFDARPRLSPDGTLIAVDQRDKTISLRDARTGIEKQRLRGHEGYVIALAFGPEGRRLVSGGTDQSIRIWDVASGGLEHRLTVSHVEQNALAVSRDGRWLAATDFSSLKAVIRLWELATGREARHFDIRGSTAYAIAFSPDGQRLACVAQLYGSGGRRSEVQVWDTATGKEWRTLAVVGQTMSCLAFSPDGRMLATNSADGNLHLWELASGRERRTLIGHEGELLAFCFSADGRRLAAASTDVPAYIWDVTGGPQSAPPPSQAGLEVFWKDLAADDAGIAYAAIWKLGYAPRETVPFLAKRLPPVAPVTGDRLAQLVADLNENQSETRDCATRELERLGPSAAPALRKTLEGKPSTDFRRRVEQLLARIDSDTMTPDQLRGIRVVEALEHLGSSDAIRLLKSLASGAPEARLTQEAKGSLARLTTRDGIAPSKVD